MFYRNPRCKVASMSLRPPVSTALCLLMTACAGTQVAGGPLLPDEAPYLEDLQQLTFGGENAEAYWSFDGKQLSLQARREGEGCDRIYRMPRRAATSGRRMPGARQRQGRDHLRALLPGDGDLLYASTHLAGDACPPRPDMSQGYVWALYDSYDIFKRQAGRQRRCSALTSDEGLRRRGHRLRQGRLDRLHLHARRRHRALPHGRGRQEREAPDPRRPATTAARSSTPTARKIVWRASRPRPGKELDDYKALLAQGLVRPSKLELCVANADGSEPMQVTYLDAASFAPFFHPTEDVHPLLVELRRSAGPRVRPLGDARRRHAASSASPTRPGFDGFPLFSPDGKLAGVLVEPRHRAEGKNDTNVFLARWKGLGPLPAAGRAPGRPHPARRRLAGRSGARRGAASARAGLGAVGRATSRSG